MTHTYDPAWIAVGSTESVGSLDTGYTMGDTGIYVCAATVSGSRMWEYRYDISGSSTDIAYSIIELRNTPAYIVVGSTAEYAFAMKIDTNGTEIWTQTYDIGLSAIAYDVIETTQGSGSTSAGDLIICGRADYSPVNGGGNGFVMRTDASGVPIWLTVPKVGTVAPGSGLPASSHEWFNAVIEIQTHGGLGDIVAAGVATDPQGGGLGYQGYTARIDWQNGELTGPNHGVTYYGGTASEGFQDVIELQHATGDSHGNLLFVGWSGALGSTFDPPTTMNVYVVKTEQDPCTKVNSKVLGQWSNDTLREFGMAVEEIRYTGFFGGDLDTGDVVITGAIQTATDLSLEMMLLPLETDGLTAVANVQHFGDQIGAAPFGYCNGMFWEVGASVCQVSDGFMLCGVSGGNLEYDTTSPDYNDVYLVRTDEDGLSGCDDATALDDSSVTWSPECAIPDRETSVSDDSPTPDVAECYSHNLVCSSGNRRSDPCDLCKRRFDIDPATGQEREWRLRMAPNPAHQGRIVQIDQRLLTGPDIRIEIVDNVGEIVSRQTLNRVEGASTFPVSTGGLVAGNYTVIVIDGSRRFAGRLVILN